jgi:ADP-heptose:LPS heptosyltransferase
MHITTVIDLELFSRFTALLCAMSGARSRIGFASHHDEGLYRGSIINFPVRYNAHVHISVNFVSLVNTALGCHTNPYTTTPVHAGEIKLVRPEMDSVLVGRVKEKIAGLYPEYNDRRIVLINPNASDLLPQRRWMPERFAAVTKALLEEFEDILVVATGAPGEKAYVQNVVDTVGHRRCVNSAGVFLFEELVPLYSISTVMLTNDSGPAHFAAATQMKVFVLFGPETPALYLPLGNAEAIYLALPCSPCVSAANHRKTTCITRPCITGIKVGMVLPKLIDYLRKDNV